jgi:hypothetical protein
MVSFECHRFIADDSVQGNSIGDMGLKSGTIKPQVNVWVESGEVYDNSGCEMCKHYMLKNKD